MTKILYDYYWTNSVFVKHILLHISGSWPIRVRFLNPWAVHHRLILRSDFLGRAASFSLSSPLHSHHARAHTENCPNRFFFPFSEFIPWMNSTKIGRYISFSLKEQLPPRFEISSSICMSRVISVQYCSVKDLHFPQFQFCTLAYINI